MTAQRVIVVGAGITGLATAHAILAKAPDTHLTVLESSPRAGGNISTERADGFILDGGPDSWVSAKPYATALAREIGLEGELVGTIEKNRRVYVAAKEGLYSLPEGFVLGVPTQLWPIVKTPLFSLGGKMRMGLEPFVPKRQNDDEDESIASFVSRRLGREVADRLVAPLLGGIYGGDATALSIRATLPQFVEAEAKHGSLVWAMRAQKKASGNSKPMSAFLTLRGGIGGLVDRLALEIGERLRTGASVSSVTRLESGDARGRFALDIDGQEPLFADSVVLALPARAASPILAGIEGRASSILGAIPHASTAVVFLALRTEDIHRPLDATGYIVPRSLGSPVLAATWVSSKWEGRAPEGMVLIRVFLGGAGNEDLVTRDDAALAALAKAELRARMNVTGEPVLSRVHRFVRASAQPLVGHLARIEEVNRRLASFPGLFAIGSGYDGVGIPDCVRQARRVANEITAPRPAR